MDDNATDMDDRSPFKRSIETQTLVDMFGAMGKGASVTDQEINALVHEDGFVENKRHIVESSREIARHEYRINIERIENTGYRVLTDEETALYPWVAKVRNAAQRHSQLITYIEDFDKLSSAAKLKHQCSLTLLRLVDETTGKGAVKKLEGRIKQNKQRLDVKETLKLFWDE